MAASKKFQAPRGTRDFYPADMAVRRYIESVWRQTSINHGFDEVEGPTIEHLDLYTHKSGPGIVSELFQVYSGKDEKEIASIRSGADAPYALRPEFTPTLARMIAARAAQLPKPIKWFAIPGHYRAERPQRGRLREFFQWNVDFVGGDDDPAKADAEVIAVAVSALEKFGLRPGDIAVRVSNRNFSTQLLCLMGVAPENLEDAFAIVDRRGKVDHKQLLMDAAAIGFDPDSLVAVADNINSAFQQGKETVQVNIFDRLTGTQTTREVSAPTLLELRSELSNRRLEDWYKIDLSIVRGLAYYTGTVFEIIADGERAVAGGGRYDKLIESFGGPSMPACGFGMGDVVLGLLLHEKGLLPEEVYMKPLRPHVFVIAASDDAARELPRLVAKLRAAGYHVRHSYRSTRNVGKLLGEASKAGARTAVILDADLAAGRVQVKDMEAGSEAQQGVALAELEATVRDVLQRQDAAGV